MSRRSPPLTRCAPAFDALPGATHHHMGCLREVLVMEGGGDDAALAAPEVALADQQAVAQSPLEDLAGEVPFDIVLAVGDEDVLDEIGFIDENEVVEEKPRFAEVGDEGVAGVHGQLVVAQQSEELDQPGWLNQRFGYNAWFVGDCGVDCCHRCANSIWTAGASRSSVLPRFRGTSRMESPHRTAIGNRITSGQPTGEPQRDAAPTTRVFCCRPRAAQARCARRSGSARTRGQALLARGRAKLIGRATKP